MSIQDNNNLQTYMTEISQTDLLTREQEVELAARIKKGDAAAVDLMIRANLRLVVKIAQDYANYGLPLADLISEGNIGLMKAVERFDPEKGGKLSTYGAWWIKQGIRRALANQSKTIRLPAHMVDKVSKMRRANYALCDSLGRDPTHAELAQELGVSEKAIDQWKRVSMHPASLDAPLGEDGSSIGEIVGDTNAQSPFDALNEAQMNEELVENLRTLDTREQDILNRRYGLGGYSAATLEDVGKVHRITRERVRQIQNLAIKKLRSQMGDREDEPQHEDSLCLSA